MDAIAPFPPKNPPIKKGGPSRRKSMSITSAGGMMARRGSISQSKTGLYSSGMYSSKMMKGGTHGLGEKHGGGGGGRAHQVQVFDADGNDVTPLSLLPPPKPSGYKGGSHSILAEGAKSGLGSESAADFLNNLESMTIASQFNTSTFGRSMYASKASGASMNERDDDDASSLASAESDLEDDDAAVEYRKKEVEVKHFTEAELAAPVSILLSETETIWLLEIPGVSVASDSPDEEAVKSANEKYKELKATRSTNDNFVDRATQTFNLVSKNKDVQATVLKQAHVECMVNEWNIYDTFVSREVKSSDSGADIDHNKDASTGDDDSINADVRLPSAGPISASTLQSIRADSAMLSGSVSAVGPSMSMGTIDATGTTTQSIMNGDYGDSMSVTGSAAADNLEGGRISLEVEVTLPDSIIDTLKLMEVNVTANNYLQKHVEYRDLPNLTAEKLKGDEQRANAADVQSANATKGTSNEEEEKTDMFGSNLPTLQFLWSYRCDRTRDRTVNYLSWNKQNEDILAAAYSECQTYPNQSLGLILCWSLKNPEYPDRIYKADSPVTTIAFSSTNPNLLAAGFNDGRIAIYDIRNATDRPLLDNGGLSGKHRDPVWELKWVEHERNIGDEQSHGETLLSISTDGRVVQWLIRKGLEFTDLMTLKRITKQEGNKGGSSSGGAESSKSSSFISRQAGGLCFDFNGKDSNIYLAGTEDGHLHRCSCSYNEQYLDTYFGHTGPVYRVKWSPFYHQAFLSCSADWTARLWHQDNDEPVLKFQSGRDSITDVSWSPTCATVFGCVTRDGRIEIWDLQFSILDPVILHSVLDRKLTAIVFAEESPVVLTGDDTGQINVYKLRNVQSGVGKTRDEKAEILAGVMRSKKQIPA